MDSVLKRILAIVIDVVIISLFTFLCTRVIKFDPYIEKYDDVYQRYVELTKGSNEIDKETIIELNYEMNEYRVVSNLIYVVVLILYFGVFQMVLKGRTIGKLLFKLRVVSNKDKELNIFQYILRTCILTNIFVTLITTILVYVTKGATFYYLAYALSIIESSVYTLNLLFITLRTDGRGLHDFASGTKVINEVSLLQEAKLDVKEEKVVKKKSNNKKKKSL